MEISNLKVGDHHYMAYIGVPAHYDFMGATQFRLLCTLGLRANHRLLDFGCGSLRAGRFFITYLDPECYYGLEPNQWLIEDAIKNQIGRDLILIKKPKFDYNENFSISQFSTKFDFILAQSIFSHSSADIVDVCLRHFRESLTDDGIIAATFVEGPVDFKGHGWTYPNNVRYCPSRVFQFAQDAGLFVSRIPWYRPSQTWYLFAKSKNRLPSRFMMFHLRGAVLFDHEFKESWSIRYKIVRFVRMVAGKILPSPIKDRIKKWANI